MTFDEFYYAGKGNFKQWYDLYGRKQGESAFFPVVLLKYATRDKDKGMSNAELSIKYGTIIKEDIGSPIKSVGAGIVSGFVAGGPIGALAGVFVGAAKHEMAEKAAANVVKAEVNAIKDAQLKLASTAKAENTLNAGVDLLMFQGKELWAIGILLLLGAFLFFKK